MTRTFVCNLCLLSCLLLVVMLPAMEGTLPKRRRDQTGNSHRGKRLQVAKGQAKKISVTDILQGNEPERPEPEVDSNGELCLVERALEVLDGVAEIPGIEKVRNMWVNFNPLSRLEKGIFFDQLSCITMLSLSKNRINEIEVDALKPLAQTLTTLSLVDNRITKVGLEFNALVHLKELLLTGNCIAILHNCQLQLPELEQLELAENDISEIEPCAFGHLPQLKEVNLTANELTVMNPNILKRYAPKLEKLKLKWNCLNPCMVSDLQSAFSDHLLELNPQRLSENVGVLQ